MVVVTLPQGAPSAQQVRAPSLIVVSNRLPFEVQRGEGGATFVRAPGGLVTAVDAVLKERGAVWVGWPGIEQEPGTPAPSPPATDGVTYVPVPLSAREIAQYYGGFSNRTLWPLCHYFVSRVRIDTATWRAYESVNQRFAAAAAARLTDPDTLIWVHDYQLMRVPALLRRAAPARRIGFFLHVPFPAADVFRVLPWARNLMAGMLGADLVGFHVREYAEHFLECAERLLGCEIDRANGRVQFEGRTVSVEAHPISIDAEQQERLARRSSPRPRRHKQILGVDRLDYTKGILERLLAVERLLEREPEYRGKVVFTQVLVPSRERVDEYQELKRQIDEVVGRVNGRFADADWSPISYMVRSVPAEELAELYRGADVALVTPLRDGMNLVAKEYVASQVEDDGVLVLSEMAGAAAELPEALIVNPYDIDAVASALNRALEMPKDERRTRMSMLRDRVRSNDAGAWGRRFLASAERAVEVRGGATAPLEAARRRLAPWLKGRPRTALFLDYDGTMTPIADRPEDARLGDEARRVLEQAVRAPDLDVHIVSGRALGDVRDMVRVDGLTYVGNHGYEIEGPGISYWHAAADAYQPALDQAARELEAMRVQGARIERKRATVSYHLRLVAPELRDRAARDAETILRRRRLSVMSGKAVLEGRPPVPWDKGQAVLHVLKVRHGPDWPAKARALYLGDDMTDEYAFRALRGIGRSILVAAPATAAGSAADLTLSGPEDVLALVRWLAAGALRTTGG